MCLNELTGSIVSVFDKKPPLSMKLGNSERDTLFELNKFNGVDWMNVELATLKEEFEAPFFFSPQAFCYYSPAYINYSLDFFEEMQLCLNNFISIFCYTDDSDWMSWRGQRVNGYSLGQWGVINQWMNWIENTKKGEGMSNFENAYLSLNTGVWNRK